MKTIVINAGPKRKGPTAKIMKSAAEGAESVGADVEYVDLYKLDLHGCMECMICKREGKSGKCYWKDETSPLIERILASDCLLIGVPIFFTDPTSHFRALMERLIFCVVDYDVGIAFNGKINVGIFYSINYSENYYEKQVRSHLKISEDLFKLFNGEVESNYISHISVREYNLAESGDESIKAKEEEFAADLKNAFEIGAKLSR
ncbi:flavodoxin family protein [uncultured Methanobrevibacter sp.]|uniref:flavodoxin family protein n=1 Tax=uncultured Methanobrevibacter sp. TaxID=253161 RepID=UPI0025F52A44|nr:flavodoxin family protein [uncultured Methanobrevibacter sp.]